MKCIKNEKGIALVMTLILSVVILGIVSAMLFMATQGTRISGSQKRFRTAEEAAVGGAAISAAFVAARATSAPVIAALLREAAGSSNNCTYDKINLPTANWAVVVAGAGGHCTSANDLTWDPTTNSDLSFDLAGTFQTYRVYAKIIDTTVGNSENSSLITGGGQLGGTGVVSANSAMISPPHIPFLYSIEIQAQDRTNPREKASVSMLYAY